MPESRPGRRSLAVFLLGLADVRAGRGSRVSPIVSYRPVAASGFPSARRGRGGCSACLQAVSTTLWGAQGEGAVRALPSRRRKGRIRAMTSRILVVDDDTALAEMIGIV